MIDLADDGDFVRGMLGQVLKLTSVAFPHQGNLRHATDKDHCQSMMLALLVPSIVLS
jgi:hypothetical protein